MSLFGTSPPDGANSQSASTLFNDEPVAGPKKESGLFADGMDEGSDSPWTIARPRQQARSNLINTMLPASDVPESYIDAFDAVLESGESFGSDVSIAGVKTLLKSSGLAMKEQTEVLSIIRPDGPTSANALGRGEFNVLLALIGLAQEKEEVTLDSVDERRSSMFLIRDRNLLSMLTYLQDSLNLLYQRSVLGNPPCPLKTFEKGNLRIALLYLIKTPRRPQSNPNRRGSLPSALRTRIHGPVPLPRNSTTKALIIMVSAVAIEAQQIITQRAAPLPQLQILRAQPGF